ncbi:MAG: 4'-phosphopantetheinyl transferase superfamily protein [Acidimicrobiales bacterium]
MPDDDGWLGPRERAVLAGLQVAKRRADWRLGRWAAKQAVRDLLGAEGSAVELLAADDGAPEAWRGDVRLPVTVSWSHRAGRAVAAVTGIAVAVGVDLELLEGRSAAFVGEWFSGSEQAWVGDDVVVRANLLWTAKEAAAKVRRAGLRLDVRALVVTVPDVPSTGSDAGRAPAGWAPLSVTEPGPAPPMHGWWAVAAGFVVSVLTDPPTPRPAPPPPADR